MTLSHSNLEDKKCPGCGVMPGQFHIKRCPELVNKKQAKPPNAPLIVEIPDEVVQYRDDLRRFVDAMVFKLKVHHKKGRWEGKTIGEYVPLLEGEVAELKEAIDGGNLMEIFLEGADVANMALIAVSIATERGK